MRFVKGDKVEVLNMCEVPSGSWRCATIISGNGRRYIVTYDEQSPVGVNVDRVPRNAMRPLPPYVGGLEKWLPGDIVEVFCSGSWKAASVISTVDGMYFFVRPHGSGQELRVHKTNLRRRQSWQDGRWFVVGKGHRKRVKETMSISLYGELPLLATENVRVAAVSQMVEDCEDALGFSFFARDNLKRKYNSNSPFINADLELACKVSPREDEWKHVKRHYSSQLEKVDPFVSPRVILGENSLRDSFNNELFETEMEESVNSNGCRSCFFPRDLEPNEIESRLCSMNNNGNITHDPHSQPFVSKANFSEDNSSSLKVDATYTNSLEWHAYRSTMEVLYASGVISWEQEVMMTNLRLSLNISNDEHLLELKQLVSNDC